MLNCKYCGKEFKDKGNLRKHEKYSHEESPYIHECPYCGKKLTASGIVVHVDRCRKNPDRIVTAYELNLENERLQKLAKEQSSGTCKFCGKLCHNQNSLRNHERLCSLNPDRQTTKMYSKEWQEEMRSRIDYSNPWNRGLTAETDERMKHVAIATKNGIQKSRKEHPERFTGKAATEEAELERRRKISESLRKNPNGGGLRHASGRGKKGWYKGFFCDSTYELVYVIYNIDHNIEFRKCNRSYVYTYKNENHRYFPDFELSDGTIVEIKGYHSELVDAKAESIKDRPIKILYEKDLKYAFDWVKDNYSYEQLTDLYEHGE